MSTSSSNDNKVVILKSGDGEIFEVDEIVASESLTIKNMIEDVSTANTIPIPNVTGMILSKVIEYCKKHAHAPKSGDSQIFVFYDELKAFDAEFIKVNQSTLCELILAANYLNIKGLLDLTAQTITDMIKDMNPEEIRKNFNIENDFTPEEEAKIRKENQWAFE